MPGIKLEVAPPRSKNGLPKKSNTGSRIRYPSATTDIEGMPQRGPIAEDLGKIEILATRSLPQDIRQAYAVAIRHAGTESEGQFDEWKAELISRQLVIDELQGDVCTIGSTEMYLTVLEGLRDKCEPDERLIHEAAIKTLQRIPLPAMERNQLITQAHKDATADSPALKAVSENMLACASKNIARQAERILQTPTYEVGTQTWLGASPTLTPHIRRGIGLLLLSNSKLLRTLRREIQAKFDASVNAQQWDEPRRMAYMLTNLLPILTGDMGAALAKTLGYDPVCVYTRGRLITRRQGLNNRRKKSKEAVEISEIG